MIRLCTVCGAVIEVTIYDDMTYSGGHYFGDLDGIEYWECDDCYSN